MRERVSSRASPPSASSFGSRSTSEMRLAEAVACESITNILLTDIIAFNMIVKYVRNAMMLPGLVSPLFTQYAPQTTTAVRPRFKSSCIIGFVAAITASA